MNELLVFVCDGAPVRGEFVSLVSTWQSILERRNDPPAVRTLMGEVVAAATLLTLSIKPVSYINLRAYHTVTTLVRFLLL